MKYYVFRVYYYNIIYEYIIKKGCVYKNALL